MLFNDRFLLFQRCPVFTTSFIPLWPIEWTTKHKKRSLVLHLAMCWDGRKISSEKKNIYTRKQSVDD